MYEGPSTEVVNIYLKRKDIDQIEEIYSFIIKVDESDLTQDAWDFFYIKIIYQFIHILHIAYWNKWGGKLEKI